MRSTTSTVIGAVLCLLVSVSVSAEGNSHKVAIHVDQNDEALMNMALNNVQNISKYYASVNDTVTIELVAYGPGLNMFVQGKSPVAQRIEAMSLGMDNVAFAGCANTHNRMNEKSGKEVPIMEEVTMVPSGVVRLIELQENGYAYIRP